eukprot:1381590-Rhodomonas_salina.3
MPLDSVFVAYMSAKMPKMHTSNAIRMSYTTSAIPWCAVLLGKYCARGTVLVLYCVLVVLRYCAVNTGTPAAPSTGSALLPPFSGVLLRC